MMRSTLLFLVFVVLLLTVNCNEKVGESAFAKAGISLSFLKENTINTQFLGHGVQWSAYPHADSEDAEWGFLMTDEKWEELYRRLDFVNPHVIRVMDGAGWRYYQGNDKDGNPIVDYNTQEVKSLYKLLDYCQKNDIKVMFGEWGAPQSGSKVKNPIDRADDDRWIEMITGYLNHLVIEKGYTCITYYNLVNEPNGYWASTDGDWDQWSAGYTKMAKALANSPLSKYVGMVGPDATVQWNHPTHPKPSADWMYSTIEEHNEITKAYEVHIYANQDEIRSGNLIKFLQPFADSLKNIDKPFLLGEIGMKYNGELGEENKKRAAADPYASTEDSEMFVYDHFYGVDMADAAAQSMLVGMGSAIAWNVDDAMHTKGDAGEKSKLKKWGMWNILGEHFNGPDELTPRPWSYPWTVLCNIFPPGSKVMKPIINVKNDSIRAVGAYKNDMFSMMLVNQSKTGQTYNVATDTYTNGVPLYLYNYVDGENIKNSSGFPVPAREVTYKKDLGVQVELPANSVVFISTIKLK
ncbi:glycoside hydrolase family 5 protein [Aquimarina sp. ERC-38]|uniref:cellulase family glycosylhydrolase n=1 Tax=Aquimarina sp. ERC-38 TaxID=2949996 RepID=UPI0022458966|nr:cellulase family glycosylhydrolase [Aquimarina sp. ERC-38]UZO80937.1 glycoside hydrolase family 5 protein [Aquimarina sp. ERC-38]